MSGAAGPRSRHGTIVMPQSTTPRRRRHADHLLERAAEGCFGPVAGFGGDGGDIGAAAAQQAGGDLHAPFGEIVHRRQADEIGEALGQHRARQRRRPAPALRSSSFAPGFDGSATSALPTNGSRRPASQPVCAGGTASRCRRITSMNISSLSLASTLSPPARLSVDSLEREADELAEPVSTARPAVRP